MPLAFPSWEGLGVGSSCLLPIAYCLPLLGGVRGGFLLPLLCSLFPVPCSLFPKTQDSVPHPIENRYSSL
ncbi:MAG: hypothetical protein F6K56_25430 [Moorea sp. SIO3G5]|nr:hypothetical protein [Moorena sp. SIO3G5]